jgi:hypothetical protein
MRQTHYKLYEQINIWGCYFRSLVAIAESWTGKRLGWRQINILYETARVTMMNDYCSCNSKGAGGGITNLAFQAIGENRTARQIGSRTRETGVIYFGYTEPPENPPEIHYSILWGQVSEKSDHYRLGDENGRLLFDPDPFAIVAKEITQLLYEVT